MPKWDDMSEDERYEYLLARLNSGSLEMVYARPGPGGLFYITLKPPTTAVKKTEESVAES